MGNCQAIDNASLAIQYPNGRVDNLYWPVTACEIMKLNPGHYVALLLTTTTTTTVCPSTTTTSTTTTKNHNNNNHPVRITRIKLLRPTDTLALGHAYRLITTEEVMKGLLAKKCARTKKKQSDSDEKKQRLNDKASSDFSEAARRSTEMDKTHQVTKHEKNRPRTTPSANSATAKFRPWQPSLNSISEAGS